MLNDNDNIDSLAKFCDLLKEYGILPTNDGVVLNFCYNDITFCKLIHSFNNVNGFVYENYECVISNYIICKKYNDSKSELCEFGAYCHTIHFNRNMEEVYSAKFGENVQFILVEKVGELRKYVKDWIKKIQEKMVMLEKMNIEEEKTKKEWNMVVSNGIKKI